MFHSHLKTSVALVSCTCTLSVALSTGNRAWARGLTYSDTSAVSGHVIAQLFQPPETPAPRQSTGGASRGQNDLFLPPTDRSAPMETSGSASRGDEETKTGTRQEIATLKAVMPPTNYGQTVTGRPTFFLYVAAEALNGNQEVFFSLQNQNQDYYYQTRLDLPGSGGGIISVPLPEDAPELAEGETYKWFFILTEKGQRLRADAPGITGWVERIQPTAQLGQQHSPASLELALSYGQAGIWYDTVKTLVELQGQSQDNTLANYWETLLTEVGLEAIASQPIINVSANLGEK